jgi:hypothetical protein
MIHVRFITLRSTIYALIGNNILRLKISDSLHKFGQPSQVECESRSSYIWFSTHNPFHALIQAKWPSLYMYLGICIETQIYEEKSKREVILVAKILLAVLNMMDINNMNDLPLKCISFSLSSEQWYYCDVFNMAAPLTEHSNEQQRCHPSFFFFWSHDVKTGEIYRWMNDSSVW